MTVNSEGTYWYDPWGGAHTADEDIYDTLFGNYKSTTEWVNQDGSLFNPWRSSSSLPTVSSWNAAGDMNFAGGMTHISENGAETAILPSGTRILNAQETREMGGNTFYITIDAKNVKEFNDIVRIVQNTKTAARRMA